MHVLLWQWFDRNFVKLGRDMRLSYLPPLMVYLAAGISGLTAIVGTFFVKEHLGLSASFLAALGFWAGIPWVLKMPVGHLIDLMWRWKSALVIVGAALIGASLGIMVLLIEQREAMAAIMRIEIWFVLSEILAPVGFVIQDAVADAMTVEAVPRTEENGRAIDPQRQKLMHTTMQTLGRVAIIGGSVLVAFINLYVFAGTESLPAADRALIYADVYRIALVIPFISIMGVAISEILKVRHRRRLLAQGVSREDARRLVSVQDERPAANWWILGGSLVFVIFTVTLGASDVPFNQEIIFAGSFAIVAFLIGRITGELDPAARETLIGTAIVIFMFRAVPGPGAGVNWWTIDALGFDPQFFSVLGLTASTLTLFGMFIFRRFMADHSISYVVGVLTIASFVLSVPYVAMYYGFHEWTARVTGGVVDARFIAFVNTALESPLGQIAMIPMLVWIARSAPANLKATYFAVMASFTNLALSLSQLGTKYLTQLYVVTREIRDPATGAVKVAADYSRLGELLIAQAAMGLAIPLAAILVVRLARMRTA